MRKQRFITRRHRTCVMFVVSPDYSWMGVWRMSGEDQIRALTRQYSYRRFPFRSGVEIHLSGERRVYPDTRVEQALHASVCGKPE